MALSSSGSLYSGPILAPMVRASFSGMRALAAVMGASVVYTSAIIGDSLRDALLNVDRSTMLATITTKHRSIESPSRVLLSISIRAINEHGAERLESAFPLIVQLTVNEHDNVEQVCRILAPWCVGIDLNLGCNASFAVSGGRGQRLMEGGRAVAMIARFTQVLQRIAEETGQCIHFSIKQRLMETVEQTVSFIQQAYEHGVSCVTVHMRKKGENRKHTSADWDMFFSVVDTFYTWLWKVSCSGDLYRLKEALQGFHIVANGDLCTRDAITKFFALSMQHFTNLHSDIQPYLHDRYGAKTPVMLARGAIHDLTLFPFVGNLQGKVHTKICPELKRILDIPEVQALLQSSVDKPPCFLSQAKALLEVSELTGSNFNNYKYTILEGIALARSYNSYECTTQRLAYKHFNQALQTPKSYTEYRTVLNTLSSKPYSHWAEVEENLSPTT